MTARLCCDIMMYNKELRNRLRYFIGAGIFPAELRREEKPCEIEDYKDTPGELLCLFVKNNRIQTN